MQVGNEVLLKAMVQAIPSTTKRIEVEPIVVEALATIHALDFSREVGFYDIIMEDDNLQIVNAINIEAKNWSRFGHFVEGIKDGMRIFRSSSFVHVRRDANSTVHGLAKEAVRHAIDKVWIEEIPHFIYGIVIKEQVLPFVNH